MGTRNRSNRNPDMGEESNMSDYRTDEAAGSEGIEDPAMEAGRQQGREMMDDATEFGGQGGQREGSPDPEGTGYTSRGRTTEETDRTSRGRTQGDGDGTTTDDSELESPVE